ncbi:response regulator [Catenovulum sp. SM1970]|uniref:tetratricopeptide repeat-containing response regulator n=1 Tax=Marinifaba aquimaris TaxID=2741323 RepID=UPI001571C47B|nr:tetratricopeptide repeat-containing response regulator [Marinifaba aquimaris]NTS76137.1 response regulator [Marinifaba aquimaris]
MSINLADKNILIIDDQRPFQIMLKGILTGLGAQSITLVSSGEDALKICKERTFDFFFIDYNLGAERRNGRQMLEELKTRKLMHADSVFIMVTGESNRPMVLGAIENQPDDYLMKPFSQNVLKRRLEKAVQKKQVHKKIFQALMDDDVKTAIQECEDLLSFPSRYSKYQKKLLSEFYCRVNKFQQAETLLTDELDNNRQTWCVLQLAYVYFLQDKYQKAITLLGEVLVESPLMTQAYDILAQSQLALTLNDQALATARKVIELSPYSIKRQQMVSHIARECGDYELMQSCCNAIWMLSRRSVDKSADYLLNYIRSSIEAAEKAESKHQLHKYQQEASLALQRGKTELANIEDFDFDAFSAVCNARIEVIQGRLLLAKKQLYDCYSGENQALTDLPADLYPDLFAVLCKIGEFDEADELVKPISKHFENNDFVLSSVKEIHIETKEKKESFFELHKQGIEQYKQGQYKQAADAFTNALKQAPMNSGCALNLIQSILKLLEDKSGQHSSYRMVLNSTKRILEGVKLPPNHLERYLELKPQMDDELH